MILGDDMIVDFDSPQRLEQPSDAREHCFDAVLRRGSVSETEKKIDGHWDSEAILLGIRADVDLKRIRLPDANIEGGKLTISTPCFNDGNTAATLKTSRELMGLFTHYSNCNQVWETLGRPIDA